MTTVRPDDGHTVRRLIVNPPDPSAHGGRRTPRPSAGMPERRDAGGGPATGRRPRDAGYWAEHTEACYLDAVAADPDDGREDWTHAAAVALAERLKSEIDDEEMCPTLAGCSLYTDLLRAALGEVDWYEIATHLVEDADRDAVETDAREPAANGPDDE